jgi:VWFA-related protein
MLSFEVTRMSVGVRRTVALVALTLGMALVVRAQDRPPAPGGQQPPAQQPAQPATPPGEQPVFRTGINFVRVDVIVTDKQGNPVSDLKQTDFEVTEDNKPQTVETFRLVKIDTVAPASAQRTIRTRNDEETAAADENARIFVFFLDDYHVRLGSSMSVRRPLVEFIANQLGPNDLVSVMYPLTPLDAVTLTRDHQSVINTVEKFMGRKFDYEPKNELEMRYVYRYPAETVEMIRRQVSMTALRGLSHKLGSLREGRKSIILVSEGYTALLPPQLRSAIAGMPGIGNPQRNNPFAADNNNTEDRAQFMAQTDMLQELKDVFDAANRNNTSIYAVDPRGLSAGEFDVQDNISITTSQSYLNSSMDTLRTMADNTDGRAIVNRNDLAAGMKQIIRDSSAYYLLGYNSTQAPQDGKFHEIKVKVKRSGLQVRARKGYWALTALDVERAKAPAKATGPPPAVTKALATIAPVGGHRLTRDWIGTSRGADGLTKVTFLWEPTPAVPGVKRDEARRVSLLVTNTSGDIVYRGKVPNDLAASGTGASISFDTKPGKLDVRIVVEGEGTGTLDSENRELTIPDLNAPEVIVTTPRVWFGRTAREFQTLLADANAKPTASREFRRTDRLLVRFDATAPAASPVSVTARILNQQGGKMADIPAQAPSTAGEPYVIDLPLSSFAAGPYLLEISATAEGHQPATELIAFRIGS